ncbi:hypothetical protein [Prauserella cavernicola]|uniref:Uncharacterized protein n=1 Tax=Prauserella cavernicola TaxID=2800127 RepID=A0A934QPT4_9PSEU|nr:hypothetical protein [Prauserella cavernicola]MBK1783194.1 hypothetical protein [Prauserella cavernicola]
MSANRTETARFWDEVHSAPRPAQTGRPNPVLAEIAGSLDPGSTGR